MAHITAYGSTKLPSPFIAAVPQSPYQLPNDAHPNSSTKAVLKYGSYKSIESLRAASSEKLQELNTQLIWNAQPFGSFIFGIIIDNDYVPKLPNSLITEGRYDHSLAIMTGHNQDEGSRFVPNTEVMDEPSYEAFLKASFPKLQSRSSDLTMITKTLYPPVFDGSQGYTNQVQRNNLTFADALFISSTRALNTARFDKTGYAYEFSGPPAVHGADLSFTFYDSGDVEGIDSITAMTLQQYITNFVQTQDPNGPDIPLFPPTQSGAVVQNIGVGNIGPMHDEGGVRQINDRCKFWQSYPDLKSYD